MNSFYFSTKLKPSKKYTNIISSYKEEFDKKKKKKKKIKSKRLCIYYHSLKAEVS